MAPFPRVLTLIDRTGSMRAAALGKNRVTHGLKSDVLARFSLAGGSVGVVRSRKDKAVHPRALHALFGGSSFRIPSSLTGLPQHE